MKLYLTGPYLALDWMQPFKGESAEFGLLPPTALDEDLARTMLEHQSWMPGVQHQALADHLHTLFALHRSPMASTPLLYAPPGYRLLVAEYHGPWLHPEALFLPPQAHISYWLVRPVALPSSDRRSTASQ